MKKMNNESMRNANGGERYQCRVGRCRANRWLKVDMGYHLFNHWVRGDCKWGEWKIATYKW